MLQARALDHLFAFLWTKKCLHLLKMAEFFSVKRRCISPHLLRLMIFTSCSSSSSMKSEEEKYCNNPSSVVARNSSEMLITGSCLYCLLNSSTCFREKFILLDRLFKCLCELIVFTHVLLDIFIVYGDSNLMRVSNHSVLFFTRVHGTSSNFPASRRMCFASGVPPIVCVILFSVVNKRPYS